MPTDDIDRKTPDELIQMLRELKSAKPIAEWDTALRHRIVTAYREKTAHYEIREGHSTACMTFGTFSSECVYRPV